MPDYNIIPASLNNGLSDFYAFSQLAVHVIYSVKRKNHITALVARC